MPKPKFHVAMTQCFFCGESKGILMSRRLTVKDPFDGKDMVCMDQEPCDKCKEATENAVMVIAVKDGSDHQNPYRTGHVWLVPLAFAGEVFDGFDADKQRFAFLEDSAATELQLPKEEGEYCVRGLPPS